MASQVSKIGCTGSSGGTLIVLLVPTHNEVENVPRLLKSWRERTASAQHNLRFCFVDDGSTDGTREFLSSAGSDVELVCQDPCQGPGAAFQRGFNHLLPLLGKNDVLVTLEADNTSDVKIAGCMFDELENGADLVLAACYAEGGGIVGTTPVRIFLSTVANRLLKSIFRLPQITTFTSFYRACRPDLLQRISENGEIRLRLKGFVCMAELLLMAGRCEKIGGAHGSHLGMRLFLSERQDVRPRFSSV